MVIVATTELGVVFRIARLRLIHYTQFIPAIASGVGQQGSDYRAIIYRGGILSHAHQRKFSLAYTLLLQYQQRPVIQPADIGNLFSPCIILRTVNDLIGIFQGVDNGGKIAILNAYLPSCRFGFGIAVVVQNMIHRAGIQHMGIAHNIQPVFCRFNHRCFRYRH